MEQFLDKISTNSILVLVMIALEVICVPLFLHFYWPGRSKKSFTMKTISSLIFIACGFFAAQLSYFLNTDYYNGATFSFRFTGDMHDYARYIILGLVFGMLGDVILHWLKGNSITFVSGMVLFLGGHLFYIKAFDIAKGNYSWDVAETVGKVIIGIGIVIVIAILAAALITKKGKGKEPVLVAAAVYGVVLFTMLSKAVEYALTIYEHFDPVGMDSIWGNAFIKDKPGWMLKGQELLGDGEAWQFAMVLIIVGSVLFVTSDLLLGFMMAREHGFKKPPVRSLRIINILTYYTAQIIFAVSVIVVPLGFGWVEELYDILKLY